MALLNSWPRIKGSAPKSDVVNSPHAADYQLADGVEKYKNHKKSTVESWFGKKDSEALGTLPGVEALSRLTGEPRNKALAELQAGTQTILADIGKVHDKAQARLARQKASVASDLGKMVGIRTRGESQSDVARAVVEGMFTVLAAQNFGALDAAAKYRALLEMSESGDYASLQSILDAPRWVTKIDDRVREQAVETLHRAVAPGLADQYAEIELQEQTLKEAHEMITRSIKADCGLDVAERMAGRESESGIRDRLVRIDGTPATGTGGEGSGEGAA